MKSETERIRLFDLSPTERDALSRLFKAVTPKNHPVDAVRFDARNRRAAPVIPDLRARGFVRNPEHTKYSLSLLGMYALAEARVKGARAVIDACAKVYRAIWKAHVKDTDRAISVGELSQLAKLPVDVRAESFLTHPAG